MSLTSSHPHSPIKLKFLWLARQILQEMAATNHSMPSPCYFSSHSCMGIAQTLPPKHSTCLQASVPLSMLSSQPGPRHPLLGLGSPRSTSSVSGKPSISSKLGWCPPVNSSCPPPGQHLSHCDHPLPHMFLYSPGDSAGAALSQVSNRHTTPGRRPITY